MCIRDRFDSIQLGGCKLPLIPGAFSTVTSGIQSIAEMDGVMGNNLLKRFNMVYDLSLIHISEPTRLGMISYAVFCLKKKKNTQINAHGKDSYFVRRLLSAKKNCENERNPSYQDQ